MGNQFQLVVERPGANLVAGMSAWSKRRLAVLSERDEFI
jgi:hypothetical protein